MTWDDVVDRFYEDTHKRKQDDSKTCRIVSLKDENEDPNEIFANWFFCKSERRKPQNQRRDRCHLVEKCNRCHHSLSDHSHVRQETKLVIDSQLSSTIVDFETDLDKDPRSVLTPYEHCRNFFLKKRDIFKI